MPTTSSGELDPSEPVRASERREPRFVYLSDAAPDVPARRAASPSTTRARYGWRLDAANHRPLGRGVAVSTSLDACRASAGALRTELERLQLTVSAAGERAQWTWRLALAGTTVAMSPHSFARRVECQRAYEHFAGAVLIADPDAGVVRNYGPRALRAYDFDAVSPPVSPPVSPSGDRAVSR